jgi:hypothetical protein
MNGGQYIGLCFKHFESKEEIAMERILLPLVFGGGTILLVGFIIFLLLRLEKKRTNALQVLATEMGFEFSAIQHEALLARMQIFPLFKKGSFRKMRNVMTTETEMEQLTIFDYRYTTGGGDNSRCYRQTVVAFESDALTLPVFSMRPEGVLHKLGSALGMKDIDFEQHSDFSSNFVLTGDDEQSVRQFFDEQLLDLLARQKGICVESAPGRFIFFLSRRRKPEQIQEYIKHGYTIYSAFLDRLSRSTSISN